jgi:hypothetical protein
VAQHKENGENPISTGTAMQTLYQELKKEGIQEMILNAFEKGLPDDTIASISGFSKANIRKIKNAWLSTKKSEKTH